MRSIWQKQSEGLFRSECMGVGCPGRWLPEPQKGK